MLQNVLARLHEVLAEEPLRRKVLLAGSYAQGQQLLERLCFQYGRVVNVDVATVRGLAAEKTKLELFLRGVKPIEERQSFWIVRHLMEQLAAERPDGYIAADLLKPGIVEQMFRALSELRLAGLTSAEVAASSFASRAKAEYVRELLQRFERYLAERKLVDTAGMFPYVEVDAEDTLYVTFEPISWSQAERRIVDKIASDRLLVVGAETPFAANAAFAANAFRLFAASGTLAEIREGFRRLLGGGVAYDRMEVVLSDYEPYVSALIGEAERLGIPCTLSGGLPLSYCSAGQAALGLLDWLEEGYPAMKLTELLRHGRLRIDDDRFTQNSWIRVLEQSGIGWGRSRYGAILAAARSDERARVQKETREEKAVREQKEALAAHAAQWLGEFPEDGSSQWQPKHLMAWLSNVMQTYGANRSQDDQAVLNSLQELAAEQTVMPEAPMSRDLALRYARDMLSDIRIRVSPTPQPGALHVSSLADGGWSGRSCTWIAGMDERSWSMSSKQDPVLLDEERSRLSPALTTRGERALASRAERESRLGMIRGELWLSYASYEVGEQKGRSAAFELLQMYRLQTGDETKDFGALERELGEPYGVMDAGRQRTAVDRAPLDAIDVWAVLLTQMGRSRGGGRSGGRAAIRVSYPALTAGFRAALLRQGGELSEYDGWIGPDVGVSASPEAASGRTAASAFISVSQLEQYASCGLRYYYGYVLGLRLRSAPELDRTRWLQANEKGSLLHELFRRYMEEATANGTKPAEHDRGRLAGLLERVIAEYAEAIPAPSAHVFEKETEELRRDAEVFYRSEAENTDQPVFFELELTLEDGEPMEVALANGARLSLRGFIDRIDRIAPHRYRIIDYKTGSTAKYGATDYFAGGTQLQHAVYAVAAEQWMRVSGYDSEARVVEADYRFPTARGRGDYVRREQNRREELAAVVQGLLEARAGGIYIPAADTKQCRWCDYQAVCAGQAERMVEKRALPVNEELLRTLLEVESFG